MEFCSRRIDPITDRGMYEKIAIHGEKDGEDRSGT